MTHREDLRSLLKGIVRETVAADLLDVEVTTRTEVYAERGEIGGVRVEFTLSHAGMSKLSDGPRDAGARLRAAFDSGETGESGEVGEHGPEA